MLLKEGKYEYVLMNTLATFYYLSYKLQFWSLSMLFERVIILLQLISSKCSHFYPSLISKMKNVYSALKGLKTS